MYIYFWLMVTTTTVINDRREGSAHCSNYSSIIAGQARPASLFLHGASITLTTNGTAIAHDYPQDLLPWYDPGTPINATIVWPATITSANGDLLVPLRNSTIASLATNTYRISLGNTEYASLVNQIYAPGFTFNPLHLNNPNDGRICNVSAG